MKNFFQFIWNNQFTFLFFLLEFIGFALLTTNNNFHQSKLHTATTAIAGNYAIRRDAYTKYIGLQEENERLHQENVRLREYIDLVRSYKLKQAIPFNYSTAHAINSSYQMGNNFIILDKGSADGIKAQQGVIGPEGVVGIVSKLSEHYSSVLPLIHSQSLTSCRLSKNDYFGILKWDGKDDRFAILEDIPNHVGVFEGDSVVTRGAAGVFPADLLIGTAVSSEKDESSGFQSIKVRLATNFRSLYNVYVIDNEAQQEINEFIESTEE